MKTSSYFAAVACATALSGCGLSESDGPPSITPDQAIAEFEAESAQLELPAGRAWPQKPIMDKASDGAGLVYQPGFGTAHADRFWFCAWEEEALKAQGRRRAIAIETLGRYQDAYAYTKADSPETVQQTDRILSQAQLGDVSGLQADYELNCPSMLKP